MTEFIWLGLLGGFLAVDDRAGWQSLLAQPVFASIPVGLITGHVAPALAVGVVLELVWLSVVPIRGTRRPDHVAGVIVGAGSAGLLLGSTGDPRSVPIIAVGILLGLGAGEVGARVSSPLFGLLDRGLSGLRVSKSSSRWRTVQKLSWTHAGSAAYIFVAEAFVVLLLLLPAHFVGERLVVAFDGPIADGLVRWRILAAAIGAASVVHLFWQRNVRRVFLVSAVLAALVLWMK